MPEQTTPRWQPISQLAVIAAHIDGMLAAATEQYTTLERARPQPWVLDDAIVGRVIAVFTAQQTDLPLFDEQLRRWATGTLTPAQRAEVARLTGQMGQLHTVVTAILRLAAELQTGTIDKQLAKSDRELGIEALRKGWPTKL